MKNLDLQINNFLQGEKENLRNTEKMIDSFLYEIKEVAMLPFSNILAAFPRMVNDISKELKKDINFKLSGEYNEIDRRILQEIQDPLIHIIRNCVDHGIEPPKLRKKLNKPERGNISLSITINESGKVEILIEDDGKGIDTNAVKDKLLKENIITDRDLEKINDEDLTNYLFLSGFTTKEIITDISGRGLGLAIVKEKLERLGGKIEVNSIASIGTKFKLILPVALSTFKGVIIESAHRHFIIPSMNVERIIRVNDPEIKTIENRESICFENITYPIIDLNSVLELKINTENIDENDNTISCIIIEKNNKYMALKVDSVLEEKEILVKDLGAQLKKVKNISGATILNSGEIVPILNIQDLFLTAENLNFSQLKNKKASKTSDTAAVNNKNKLLVVEDSITSRMLIRNILESSGYTVETAVDGVAGLTLLKTQKFDLVVSDIEMPRMDGFTLTQKVRSDDELNEIPIILLTSLASDEDKERGIDAGANAYIIKSHFDQNNLLETIESLI